MERLLLSLVVVVFFALCVYGMWRGWRRQARAQSVRFPPFPQVPDDLGEPVLDAKGLYVATTTAGHWQERVVTRGVGLRGPAVLRYHDGGIEVDRVGATGFWIPRESIVDVKTGRGMAGKVMGTESLLVVSWRLGETELDTGFRGDDIGVYPQWIAQVKGGAQV
ncbi:transporter [Saccharomonospora sp. NPDC046836]|uniref:PH-like domain-containing protein n=1 Tax=Saccharomonospora sp. NPDC046836 TaxID=3156921 RepID=UPI0033E7947B